MSFKNGRYYSEKLRSKIKFFPEKKSYIASLLKEIFKQKKKKIPDENLNLHKGRKSARNVKYLSKYKKMLYFV